MTGRKHKMASMPTVTAPVTVLAPKRSWVLVAKKPFSVIASFLWDAKANTFSISRLQFLLTSVFGAYLIYDVRNIIVDAYRAGRAIPDLEWYIMAIVAYIGTGPVGYGFSRIGTRNDRYPPYDPVVVNKDEMEE